MVSIVFFMFLGIKRLDRPRIYYLFFGCKPIIFYPSADGIALGFYVGIQNMRPVRAK
jgi:hypothetical protein